MHSYKYSLLCVVAAVAMSLTAIAPASAEPIASSNPSPNSITLSAEEMEISDILTSYGVDEEKAQYLVSRYEHGYAWDSFTPGKQEKEIHGYGKRHVHNIVPPYFAFPFLLHPGRYSFQMIRQQMSDIKDACQEAGWEKVKAMQNAEKQGKNQSDMRTNVVHVLFLVLKNPVQAEESQ